MRKFVGCFICLAIIIGNLLFPAIALAEPILLYNTGVDDSFNLLSGGSIDPHYQLVSSPDTSFAGPAAYITYDGWPLTGGIRWLSNGPDSKWISPRSTTGLDTYYPTGSGVADGYYTYRTSFDLSGLNPGTAVIDGWWVSDNFGTNLVLNGVITGFTNNGDFMNGTRPNNTFHLDSGFISGVNNLDFIVYNAPLGFNGINPSGLRVELSGTAAPVPEPSTMLLLGSGLAGLIGYGKRRFKK
jgi:hypothetical protein